MAKHTTEAFITPPATLSFPQIFVPKLNKRGKEEYTAVLLVPKTADMSGFKAAVAEVINRAFGHLNAAQQKALRRGIRDGDAPNSKGNVFEGFPGHYVINVKSQYKPGTVDEKVQPVLDAKKFYAGCKVIAQLIAYDYDVDGNTGVAFGLQNIQFVGDGAKLGNASQDAASVFTAVPGSAAATATGDSADDFLGG